MESALTAVVAVAGTLMGSVLTYLLQRLTAKRAEIVARDARLREERLAACSAFAGAVTELRRAVITLWFQQRDQVDGRVLGEALAEADRRGAAADQSRFRVQLVVDDAALLASMAAPFDSTAALRHAANQAELRAFEERCQDELDLFIAGAKRQLG